MLTSVLALAGCGEVSVDITTTTSSTEASTTTTTADTGSANMMPCRTYSASINVGTVTDPALDELSGLVTGVTNPNVVWTHNDSGDSARIFALDMKANKVAAVTLKGANAFDYEDIAIDRSHGSELWVADIGDNLRFRGSVQLYHFPEPSLSNGADQTVEATRVNVNYQRPGYEGNYSINAEALFFDKVGNAYIVEKTEDEKNAWVFRITAADLTKKEATARPVAQIVGNSDGQGGGPTAADVSADGTTLAIKNYSKTFVWRFSADSSIPAVLQQHPSSTCVVKAGLGEAITFVGNDFLTVEEGVGKPLRKTSAR